MIVSAIIPVAGKGKRFGGSVPKQYMDIHGQPAITITLQKFVSLNEIDHGVVVVAEDEQEKTHKLLNHIDGFQSKFEIVPGGKERQDSVYCGIQKIAPETDIVIVHDGVRPLVTSALILESIKTAAQYGACVVAVPVKETIKQVQNDTVIKTIPRDLLWQIQTPQSFRYSIIKKAHEQAKAADFYSTDESALVEWIGYPVRIVRGDYANIKLTNMEDLELARTIFRKGWRK
jgi:2-C-methyl-D-erythritol 4-phosphate cytidylyltransferase